MNLRAGLLDECDALAQARAALLALAQDEIDTIVPAYTHGGAADAASFTVPPMVSTTRTRSSTSA